MPESNSNFRLISTIDISNTISKINALIEDDWKEWRDRKEVIAINKFSEHIQTFFTEKFDKGIFLVCNLHEKIALKDGTFRSTLAALRKEQENTPKASMFQSEIDMIEDLMRQEYNIGKFRLLSINRVEANTSLLNVENVTKGFGENYNPNIKSVKIILKKNQNDVFFIKDEIKDINVGEVWELNDFLEIHNNGTEDLIYIKAIWLAEEYNE